MKTINPYRRSAAFLWYRFCWDLNPLSWKSRKKITRIRNIRHGEKCIILCNGPSLLKTDFHALMVSGVFTFGLNKINLLFDKTDFRPSAIVAVNSFVLKQNLKFYNTTSTPLFVDSRASGFGVKDRKNVHFLHSTTIGGVFAEDCSLSVFQGHTVTYVAMQLAFHMGFSEVALVGADHYFYSKGPPNKIVESGESDQDHFDENYFAGGVKWELPDLFQSELAYRIAKHTFEQHGRRVVNCTEGGHLEIFDREELPIFLGREYSRE
ncbi:6-hydroxymethylpterin diphosphokinase MptE-like protein [uncultured Desulfobacter sp.]|uniref:6-hydroxymethylpterin diphosphokinase MptE-like protein n=1 Tax=uncultured Desulfobacter sp. TaxID=240139 RepID=UPI002AA77336|nr:6-hydroxymethylpterin diphosphokinase MptE-like protein [uncultured Desulfobacter sp.]